MATTPVPSKIGKYDVIGVIGRGGMGVVYQAMDPHLDRKVAIKMITGAFSENPDMLKRFFREAQSLGSLQHPNIVTVFDLGDYGGNPYFVMEYLEGEGLDAVMSNHRPLNLLEKIAIIIQVCNGLGYAHRRGVVHRDIKPANIMINKDGAIKIFDFGIAHAGQMHVTRTGEILGTLRYMAPEQINGKTVDSRTDIFSLGVVFYQLITDHLPFDGDNTATTLLKIVNDQPPPLSSFLQNFPPEMEQILLRALAKSPDERYGTADDFALDLAQLQGQLKEELIGQEMSEAALLIEQGEVYKAQGTLLRVLKIDLQHTKANRLLREVQQRIQRDEVGKQVRGLQERAQEALADQQFDRALEHVDRALALGRDNFDLMQLREAIREAAVRAEKLQKALKTADAAHADGKLEEAREAVEAALAIAPGDTQARTLYRLIGRELEERARQQQMEGYLLLSRQELSSRKFTAALMILKKAEELDPSGPQVHSLMESAVAGQEQERRRRELDALTHAVEEALNRDDYQTACQKANEGLVRFPDDRNLLTLKALADRQRQIEERKQLVDTIMGESRVLLQDGRHEELKDKLEKALAQLGPEARLQSLLGVVSERPVREQAEGPRSERLEQPRQALRDSTLFSKTPPSDSHISNAGSPTASDELQPACLPIVERHLALYIGPLAKVLVKRAAAKTTSVLELYAMLSASIEKESDRHAFLARSAELVGSKASGSFTKLATPPVAPPGPVPLDIVSAGGMTPAVVDQAAKRLTALLGPIAPIVARKEAKRATNMREFYALLAEHIVSSADRERFLKESGAAKEPGLLTLRNEITSISARPGSPNAPTAQFKPDLAE